MGDLREGDEVFDETGSRCRVTFATDVMHNHVCFRVHFSDGTSIVADAEHIWQTKTLKPEGKTGEWTTDEIRLSLRRGDGAANHSIGVAGALDTDECVLPIDPYTLGVWLGDGSTGRGQITNPDSEVWARVIVGGYQLGKVPPAPNLTRTALGLQVQLRELGVLGDKHIPRVYLRASRAQRLERLRGLLDTDGTTSAAGQATYTTTLPTLRDGFLELARSLGFKPTLREFRAVLEGKDYGPAWDVQFWPFDDAPVFYIDRKRARQKPRPNRRARSETRQIVDVEPVASVPVRCIQVDSPSHLYLAGESMVPTHNTELAAALGLYFLIADEEPSPLVICAAASDDQADLVYGAAKTMCEMSPTLSLITECFDKEIFASHGMVLNQETGEYELFPNPGAVLKRVAAVAGTNDGKNIHAVICDELHEWALGKGQKVWTVLTGGSGARRRPMVLQITTAGFDENTICFRQYEYCKAVANGTKKDRRYHFYWIEPPSADADHTDPNVWEACNPSLGVTVTKEWLEDQLTKKPENVFRRYYLNQWTASDEAWLPAGAWASCRSSVEIPKGGTVYVGIDIGIKYDSTAIALVHPREDDFIVRAQIFNPPTGDEAGDRVDLSKVRDALDAYAHRYRIAVVAYDRWNFEPIAQEFSEMGLTMSAYSMQPARTGPASARLFETITAGKLRHNGNKEFSEHVQAGAIKKTATGWRLDKQRTKKPIDALIALMMALDVAADDTLASNYNTRGIVTV